MLQTRAAQRTQNTSDTRGKTERFKTSGKGCERELLAAQMMETLEGDAVKKVEAQRERDGWTSCRVQRSGRIVFHSWSETKLPEPPSNAAMRLKKAPSSTLFSSSWTLTTDRQKWRRGSDAFLKTPLCGRLCLSFCFCIVKTSSFRWFTSLKERKKRFIDAKTNTQCETLSRLWTNRSIKVVLNGPNHLHNAFSINCFKRVTEPFWKKSQKETKNKQM